MAISFDFINSCWKNCFEQKVLELEIDIARYTGGQGKYMKFGTFSLLSVIAALSISKRITSTEIIHSLTTNNSDSR
jgi:hypothetical protein